MKVSIIGMGNVGSTLAYTLMLKGLASELILVNRTKSKAQGDAYDLIHAQSFTDTIIPIKAGDIEDTIGSDVIVLTHSVPYQESFKNRMDLLPGNMQLFADTVPELARLSPNGIFLVVTNPVDVLTYGVYKLSGFAPSKVLGIGTLIDSARFRSELSQRMGIAPDDIRAYIFGEHGDSQFPATSLASAGGERINDEELCKELLEESVILGHKIMKAKGYTNYAIAMATSLVVEVIYRNSHRTMPIATYIDDYLGIKDNCFSIPVVVGREGILRIQKPNLSDEEVNKFQHSASIIQQGIDKIKHYWE
ncbi:lactate/malate family dehydrogenase [Spirochaeta cellobiosiphila]|uniref:lactate/malate family dehydrogenase n=1 Tax=Spirochaeta cellobiosiphila TaxID=504483 RepID=UPI0004251224|nr:hypothetical protein [Spirochaeta cellobiosiphila]